MLPVLQAIGMIFTAISAAGTIKSFVNDFGASNATAKTKTATSDYQTIAAAASASSATPADFAAPSGATALESSAAPVCSAAPASSAAIKATDSIDPQDQLLQLLMAQLKNHGSLNPLYNAHAASQSQRRYS
jgi:prophage DNA circulation protein